MTMGRETLRAHLHNPALVQIVAQKQEVDATRNKLIDALTITRETGIDESVTGKIQKKIDEYGTISRNYGLMMEEIWGISWHWERTLEKYIDCNDNDIDELPEVVRPA